jgi:hypothetical protein
MSQFSCPEIPLLTWDASFLPGDPGSACLKPRKTPEAAFSYPIPLIEVGVGVYN